MDRTLLRGLAIGAALLLIGLALPAPGGPALAQGLPPRPTTVAPTPTDQPDSGDGSHHSKPLAPGRITGTVIDTRTSAPAPGLHVRVGAALVQSDASGNYDLNGLAPDRYSVALELAPGQGEPAQGPAAIDLGAGQTVVQHLFYRSPAPAAPAPDPAPQPRSAPEALPDTSGRGDGQLPLLVCAAALIATGLGLRRR